jgi:acyl dehydratase
VTLKTSSDSLVLGPGDEASITKTWTHYDVWVFAHVTEDKNPIHLDETYAATTPFGCCIVHGKLVEGLISAVLGTKLPGPLSVFKKTSAEFRAPVYPGDEVVATARVRGLVPGKPNWIYLDTWARVNGNLVVRGDAVISLPKSKFDFRWSGTDSIGI